MDKELDKLFSEPAFSNRSGRINPSGILSPAEEVKYLDTASLELLEKSFRTWTDEAVRMDVRISRKRITLIFLLIRYTGARLGEILSIDETSMIDPDKLTVRLGFSGIDKEENGIASGSRIVEIPAFLAAELSNAFSMTENAGLKGHFFYLDPAHVRRKFYERAEACGLLREFGNPSAIRRSRAIELIRNNIPLPMVQKILGHSTSSLTSAYIDFSKEDLKQVLRNYVDKESRRKTSARNSFYGLITRINKGDIQSEVEITTYSGHKITSVITNESLERLMFREKSPATAEIKAPWVVVSKDVEEPMSSASNRLNGKVSRIIKGSITTEVVVSLSDGTDVCALVTEQGRVDLDIVEGVDVWVMFSAFSVILNAD
ncbi:TOBE domain-containing protein [Desulforegula conservatrix]|uniref:TOBE domain-containing protein n=1 Tax=Desulforegula conservatrix TaxID=153026 RepID=UPI00040EC563|nr:TOBE domain-containing protein [Desulforegula conservatrix]